MYQPGRYGERACLIELGERTVAKKLLQKALEELRTMADEGTDETWSIECWVIYNLRQLEKLEEFFSELTTRAVAAENRTQSPLGQPGRPKKPSHADENRGADAYLARDWIEPQPGGLQPDQEMQAAERKVEELEATLDWLRGRSCDPAETFEWLEQQNSSELEDSAATSRLKQFDTRRWNIHVSFGGSDSTQRIVAAYRAVRLIEDAGLPLRSENVRITATIVEKPIRFLIDRDALEATGAVLRMRTKKLIEERFTRARIASLSSTEIQRLQHIARRTLETLTETPDRLSRGTDATSQFETAVELLCRVVIRASDEYLHDLIRFAIRLPGKLRIFDRWWLVDDVASLIQHACEGLSADGFWNALPDLMTVPVPGSLTFPALPKHIAWPDPIAQLDQREDVAGRSPSAVLRGQMDAAINRVLEIGGNASFDHERERLILRLVTFANRGLLNRAQARVFAKALFAKRETDTGFPAATGCLDSAILLAPPVPDADEHALFRAKYITSQWPNNPRELSSLLRSLARTGPVAEPRVGNRLRGINWTTAELEEIARRCRLTVEQQANVVIAERAQPGQDHPLRKMAATASDYAEAIVDGVAHVLDDVLLQREIVSAEAWDSIVAATVRATEVGLPVLAAYIKLASFDRRFRGKLVEEILTRLTSNHEERLKEGFSALNHWANQLADSRTPAIPDSVIAATAGMLTGNYSYSLIHVLDTVRNLLDRLPAGQAKRLLNRCEFGMEHWSRRLTYEYTATTRGVDDGLRQELPDLRASMTRLCVAARRRHLASNAATRWLESVQNDSMPEVRQALDERAE